MEILRTENLCKTYGSGENAVRAVDNVNLSVEKGEFVTIFECFYRGKMPPTTAWTSVLRFPKRSSKKPAALSASIPSPEKEAPLPSSSFQSRSITKPLLRFRQQGFF